MSSAAASPIQQPEVAVVRQPILDQRRRMVGYELTFVNDAASQPGVRATSALLLDVFGDIGLERLVGGYPAWLGIARDWIVEVGMPPLRPDKAVLEIDAYPADDDLLNILQKLARTGFTLALSGFDGRDDLGPLLAICGTVKIDVSGRDDADLAAVAAQPAAYGARLIATGVSTDEQFERCRAHGFAGFQGEFFARPRTVRGTGVATAGIGALRTLGELTAGDVTFEDLDRIISADVGLSLKLLRYVNSAFFALPRTISSVREALALLGTRTVARWATVMAMSTIPDTPSALIETALHRARMCEVLGARIPGAERESFFTVGLFSVADALLNSPMEEVLESLPFDDDVRDALLRRKGPKGQLLEAVTAYERGEYAALPSEGDFAGLSLATAYREALEWADEASRATG